MIDSFTATAYKEQPRLKMGQRMKPKAGQLGVVLVGQLVNWAGLKRQRMWADESRGKRKKKKIYVIQRQREFSSRNHAAA